MIDLEAEEEVAVASVDAEDLEAVVASGADLEVVEASEEEEAEVNSEEDEVEVSEEDLEVEGAVVKAAPKISASQFSSPPILASYFSSPTAVNFSFYSNSLYTIFSNEGIFKGY